MMRKKFFIAKNSTKPTVLPHRAYINSTFIAKVFMNPLTLFFWRRIADNSALRKTAPRALLLALFVLVSGGILASCGGGNSTPPTLDQTASLAPVLPARFKDATFAGKTSNTDMFAAVVTHADGIEAYFCDGKKDFWFRGLPSELAIEMSEASGGMLLLQVANDVVVGRLTVGDDVTTFELPKAGSDALYRAETFMGQQRILGGWIKLANGEQRGTIRNGQVTQSSALDLSNLSALKPVCTGTGCDAFVGGLTPVAFTPELASTNPNSVQKYTVIGLGDSFMSGEGAPVVLGDLPLNRLEPGFIPGPFGVQIPGIIPIAGFEETWSSGLPTSDGRHNFNLSSDERTRLAREARACHRGAAGLGLAVDALRDIWPRSVSIIHQTFACSGAKIENLINTTFSGPAGCSDPDVALGRDNCLRTTDDMPTRSISAQLPETQRFLIAQRLSLDAVVMSIGGNNIGFGSILADCLSPLTNCSDANSKSEGLLRRSSEVLDSYKTLAGAIAAIGTVVGTVDTSVFLAQHPNPIEKADGSLCSGVDFLPDTVLQGISAPESQLALRALQTINAEAAKATAELGWKNVPARSGRQNSICSDARWHNTNLIATSTQGSDLPTVGLFLSSGIFHPNQRGHREGYMPAYRDSLNAALTTRFTPRAPTRFRPATAFADGTVNLVWDDMNSFESKTVIRNTVTGQTVEVPADRTSKSIDLNGTLATFRAKSCFTGPGNVDICSAETAPITVEAKKPTNTPQVARNEVSSSTTSTLAWSDLAPSRMWTTLELVDASSVVTKQAVAGQSIVLANVASGTRFRVAACNDLGCGPATERTLVARSTALDLASCTAPQKRLLNGRCGLADNIVVQSGTALRLASFVPLELSLR